MKFRHLIALALVLQFTLSSLAQQPTQTAPGASPANPQQPGLQPDDEVVKITTNLVQVDAVVTDKNDRQITDLRPDELEIFEDGKPQQITNFSYVSTEDGRAKPTEQSQRDSQREAKAIGPVPPIRLRQEQVRRTIALVVDDLGLSFLSISTVRQALKKFVDQQMQPGDLVAIIRTSGGIGALQQFTSDKRVLYAAIEKIRWSVTSRGGIAVFAPMAAELESKSLGDTPATAAAHEDLDQFREELYTVGTLGALNYIVRGLRALPGRKSVILLSDGMTVFNLQKTGVIERQSSRVIEAQKRLVDLANRASVVIYTIDPRGIPTFGLQASDDVSNMSDADIQATLTKRSHDFADSQAALGYLAQETGGLEIKNQNDISGGLRRVLDDQRGYYLIGYRPDESTFDKPGRIKFHHLSLRVKRPGKFNIRLRSGFLGVTQAQAVPTRTTRDQQLLGALVSPFGAENVHLRSTSLF
ncbi:MAG TPA: VWA domain-containing protein, partial [Pyrinomonadaceae bacterium]|nr:VWA domain-containing protein [Pyrinomonadaceae bacterium]